VTEKRDLTALPLPEAHPEGRTSPEQRREIREIVGWLKDDLFERVPVDGREGVNPMTTMIWQSPLKWTVLLSPRKDGKGYVGEVRSPDGGRVSTTSHVDLYWLEEKLP
jgi:hypothetical protein